MAQTVATLGVDISANFAKLYEGLTQATSAVNKSAASMKDAFGSVGSSLVNLAAGVASVGAVLGGLKSALNFGDELQTSNERLGISVEKLQELSGIAVQNNTSIEALGKSFKFLGDSMIKSQTAGSEQARLFAALGVATKDAAGNLRAVDEVTADTADALNQIGNETVRTAAGVAIFGKSYLEVAAALRTFRESQAAANENIEQFGAVTATVTKTADAFGDKLKLLEEGLKAATLVGITPGISALNSALEAITPTIAIVAKAFGDFFGWLGTQAAVWIINAENLLRKLGAAIGALAASIATLSTAPLKELEADIKRLDVQRVVDLAKALNSAKFPGLSDDDQLSRRLGAADRLKKAIDSKSIEDALRPVDDAFRKAFDSISKVLATAEDGLDNFGKAITEQTSPSMKALLNLMSSPEWDKFSKGQRDRLIDIGLTADAIDHETAALKLLTEHEKIYQDIVNKAADAQNAAIEKNRAAGDALIASLEEQNAEYEFQISLIGKTAAEQETLTALHRIDIAEARALAALNDEALLSDIERIKKASELARVQAGTSIQIRDALQEQARAGQELFRTLTEAGQNFIVDFVEHGSSAFKNLWEDFKHWALEAIAKIAAQQILINLIPSLAGPAAGVASGGILGIGGLSSLTDIFKIFSGGGGLFGGIGNAIGDLSFAFADFSQLLGQGIGIFQSASTAFAGMLPALGTLVPVIGGIAAAAYGLYNYLESKKGGPKEGGFAAIGVNRGSYFPTEETAAGNAATEKLVTSISDSFKEALKRLGGQAFDIGFAIGFDTDPKGKAQSNVHGGVFKGGSSIFENPNPNVGRSPEELTAELQHQAQQMLLAALQASDLPKYVAALLNSVDVAAASSDEIASILATAEAIKSVADAFPALQTQIENLDPEQIKAFIDALGGADQLVATFGYLQKNFTTTTDAVKDATDKLTTDFTALGLAVPATHQGFLDLLSSFDLTTEAGRELYASVAALAPEFVAVAGSADEAAKKLQDATAFFRQNFYSDAEKSAASLAEATKQLDAAQEALGISIPRSAESFRALVESIDQTTPAGQALYAALVALAPQILAVSGGIKTLTATAAAAIPIITSLDTVFGDITPSGTPKIKKWVERLRDLAKETGGDLGEQLSFMVDQIGKEIIDVKAQMQKALDVGDLWTAGALRELITSLENSNNQITGELARFITLSAQYDDTKAEQLINLEKWYADQKKIYGGDAVLLDALAKIFAKKWDDIIKGTADGVDGTQDQLDRLRKSIADYLQSLQLSSLSPLTPAQKLAEAQAQYQDALAKAAAGDPTALADITKFADNYLKQARDFYASSPLYAEIFKQITDALATLAGTTPTGLPGPHGPGPESGGPPQGTNPNALTNADALTAALPSVGNRLVSADDLKKATDALGKLIADALAAVANANTEDNAQVVDELKSTAIKIVDGLGGNLK